MNISPQHSSGIELLIRNWQQFAPLTEEHRRSLRRLPLNVKEHGRNATIAILDQDTLVSILVISGSVFRYKVMPDGGRQILAMHFPGDIANLDGLVLEATGHTFAAAGPSLIAAIPHSAISQMVASQPDLARWVMWEIARDAAKSREWLAAMGRQPAYQQIAHLICEFYFRMKWAGQVHDQTLEVDLYQADLGDICGISTVHVNRCLQALRADGLITLHNHKVAIRDIDALVRVAMFDSLYLQPLASGAEPRRYPPSRDNSPDPRLSN